MEIRFWGVRGSIATPGTATSHFGGNTSCVEVRSGTRTLIFDAGTGLRPLGHALARRRRSSRTCHLLLSHFHLDHIAGLPFFYPLYQKDFTIHLYGPKGHRRSVRQIVGTLFKTEFFPVPLNQLPATLKLHSLGEESVRINNFRIDSFYLNHPGPTLGYVVTSRGRRIAYVTDHEPVARYRHLNTRQTKSYEARLLNLLRDVDVLIHDAQYLDHHYAAHRGWGHSPWSYPMHLSEQAGIRNLVLYHHDPELGDKQLQVAFNKAKRQYRSAPFQLHLAREGETIRI